MLFDEFKKLVMKDRSIRRFDQSRSVSEDELREIVELVRFCPSGRNLQPLKYCIVTDAAPSVFPLLKWAGYLAEWDGPAEGERPAAYLVQCLDTRLTQSCLCDDGIQLQTITLGAAARSLGCCIIKAFNAPALSQTLGIPVWLKPMYVVAVGYPAEQVVVETTDGSTEADIKYYRSPDGVHHVPKRPLNELIIE